jgi:signal transduction histidine kinase
MVNHQKNELQTLSDELKATNEKLIKMDEFKQSLTSMIVHDLKNPLNSIINYTDPDPEKQIKHVSQTGRQMLNLVMNMLDVHKYEDTKVALNIETHTVQKIAKQAIEEIIFISNQKNIAINNLIPDNYAVLADYEIIKRIFVNILSNAVKYTGNNGLITLRAEKTAEEFLKISISDNGLGIPADKIHLVFEKFGQVSPKNLGSVRSTGIGLTFCKMMVEAHGGEINVDSEPGKGSVFWFTLRKAPDLDIKQEQNLVYHEDNKETIFLSEKDIELLKNHLVLLQATQIYKITELRKIMNSINDSESENIKQWKLAVGNAINAGNNSLYKKLIYGK